MVTFNSFAPLDQAAILIAVSTGLPCIRVAAEARYAGLFGILTGDAIGREEAGYLYLDATALDGFPHAWADRVPILRFALV
jgi:hypothetical protein